MFDSVYNNCGLVIIVLLENMNSAGYSCVDEARKYVCCMYCRSVRSVVRRSRRTVAAITWCVNDASMTSAGSVSQRGSRTAQLGQKSCCLLHLPVIVSFPCVHGCVCLYDTNKLFFSSLLWKTHL